MLCRSLWMLLAACLLGGGPVRAAPRVPEALLARADAGETVRVLVQLAVPFAPEGPLGPAARAAQRGDIARAQADVLAALAGAAHTVHREYRSIPWLALAVDAAGLRALSASPWVAGVEEDRLHAPMLPQSVPIVEADQAVAAGWSGAGQTVVVLDTGVDGAHPNFAGKIVDEACFTGDGGGGGGDCPNGQKTQLGPGAGIYCDYSDACFHGTHVAGIAAGYGLTPPGVAAGATLISIQVFTRFDSPFACGSQPTPCPLSYVSDQIAALEAVYDDFRFSHSIAAVNMSLGGGGYTSQAACDAANAATKAAIDNLRSVGIATVVAAGNEGLNDTIDEPACISTAVSVGSTTDADYRSSFSNAASFLSLWAPGSAITAPRWKSSTTVTASGTSMAAPHVAGAWAILRQAAPTASVSAILTALQTTGKPISQPANTTRIRIAAALGEFLIDCDDGLDDDGDGAIDAGSDPGCADALDDSERSAALPCDNGFDDDGDGYADFPADLGCAGPASAPEDPQCQDGLDNDGDGWIDFDGGASIFGTAQSDPDPQCSVPYGNRERPTRRCGLGSELALTVPLLAALRARRRRARA